MMSRFRLPAAAAALLSLTPAAAEIIVTTLTDELDTPSTAGTGISLREAIRDAASGETITFDPTLDSGTIRITTELLVDKTLTIDASDLPSGIAIDGGNDPIGFTQDPGETRCFRIEDARLDTISEITFINLTIQNGINNGIEGGGNIRNTEALTLIDCSITGGRILAISEGVRGGGIENTGTLILERCLIADNKVINGPPVTCVGGGIGSLLGTVTATDCTFTGNRAVSPNSSGGAIHSERGRLILLRCTLSENYTEGSGCVAGAIFCNANIVIPRSTPPPNLFTNCTITNNSVRPTSGGTSNAGAILVGLGFNEFSHCTIIGNTSPNGVGGIQLKNGSPAFDFFALSTFTACVIRDNIGPGGDIDAPSTFSQSGNSVRSLKSQGFNYIGTGDIEANPLISTDILDATTPILLGDLADNGGLTLTHLPLAGSPLIDAAPGSTEPFDQRGIPRPAGLADIGSVEKGIISNSTIVTTLADSGPGSLRQAIASVVSPDDQIITFAPALDGGVIRLDSQLLVSTSLTIDASSLPSGIAIDGGSNGNGTIEPEENRCLLIDDGEDTITQEVSLINITLQNGIAEGSGGAIFSKESLTLTRCEILDSIAASDPGSAFGGGIFQRASPPGSNTLTLIETRFTGNCALSTTEPGTPATSAQGGAVYVGGPDFICDSSTFTHNLAQGDTASGGAIFVSSLSTTITNTTIARNTAEGSERFQNSGGGITISDPTQQGSNFLTNCTLSGNEVIGGETQGGGLYNISGRLRITHCTIIENTADFGAGLIKEPSARFRTNFLNLTSSVIRDNIASDEGSEFGNTQFSNITPISSGGENFLGNGMIIALPSDTIDATTPILLGDLADNGGPTPTHLPLAGSPLIDAATGSTQPFDQRGTPRPAGLADIGAAEFVAPFSLADVWETDADADGIPYGIETYFGTDPESPNSLPITNTIDSIGQPIFTFTLGTDRPASSLLIFERSTDLTYWEEVFFADQSDAYLGLDTNFIIESTNGGNTITLTDTTNPPAARAFYRFRTDLDE